MSYIDEIFERANLQNIREFLLHDVSGVIENKTYMDRIKIVEKLMIKNLKACTPPCKYEEMIDSVYDYAAARQNSTWKSVCGVARGSLCSCWGNSRKGNPCGLPFLSLLHNYFIQC